MARIIATTAETIAIHDALKAALRDNGDGTFSYAADQSDEAIAENVASRLTAAHVARIRVEMFGKLGKAASPEPANPADVAAQISSLKGEMGRVLDAIGLIRTDVASVMKLAASTNELIQRRDNAIAEQHQGIG
ncbi:hypothetical protein KQX64_06885 [Rhodopseudomonas palustris]|nr:hypothetical protein KQX64_06885 [Rhodopseudomonas palustris]